MGSEDIPLLRLKQDYTFVRKFRRKAPKINHLMVRIAKRNMLRYPSFSHYKQYEVQQELSWYKDG